MSYDSLHCHLVSHWNLSLNPFGTGQCLTTNENGELRLIALVSIPLEQGSVLRRTTEVSCSALSQSLWNRAVSYDRGNGSRSQRTVAVSIPLEQGSVLRLQWGHQALCDKAYRSHFPTFSETQRVGS